MLRLGTQLPFMGTERKLDFKDREKGEMDKNEREKGFHKFILFG